MIFNNTKSDISTKSTQRPTTMRYFASIVPLLATSAVAAVVQNVPRATITGNPFSGYQLYTNSYYASEVSASALPSMTGTAKAAASKAAQVPSFFWLYVQI
jgi:cellulose 1,4-beta-cellobiosidase